jgi:hypothetical protein
MRKKKKSLDLFYGLSNYFLCFSKLVPEDMSPACLVEGYYAQKRMLRACVFFF